MVLLRVLAGALLLIAALALVSDVTRSLNSHASVVTSVATHWRAISPQSLANAQGAVKGHLHPLVWDPLIWRLLLLPTWFLFGALGGLVALLGRRRRRVNIFIN